MNFSDIQLSDKQLWNQIQRLWEQGQYSAVLTTLSNQQLNKKVLTADNLNELADKIVTVENLSDPNFKADKIQLLRKPPAGMVSGQIYFKWLAPYCFNAVDVFGYTFDEVDNLNITWAQVDEGEW